MNCQGFQRRLLTLERPECPPAEVRLHLGQCQACREWHARLLRLEEHIQQLRVPPPRRKAEFLASLAADPLAPPVIASPLLAPPPRKERALRKMAVAFAMAASLLVCALGLWAWKHSSSSAPAPVPGPGAGPTRSLIVRVDSDPRWVKARTPAERLTVLREMTAEVPARMAELARESSVAELNGQVELYRDVVNKIVHMQRELSPGERPAVLRPLIERLSAASREARQLMGHYPRAAKALAELAEVAETGSNKLRDLL